MKKMKMMYPYIENNPLCDGQIHEIDIIGLQSFTNNGELLYLLTYFDEKYGLRSQTILEKRQNGFYKIPLLEYDSFFKAIENGEISLNNVGIERLGDNIILTNNPIQSFDEMSEKDNVSTAQTEKDRHRVINFNDGENGYHKITDIELNLSLVDNEYEYWISYFDLTSGKYDFAVLVHTDGSFIPCPGFHANKSKGEIYEELVRGFIKKLPINMLPSEISFNRTAQATQTLNPRPNNPLPPKEEEKKGPKHFAEKKPHNSLSSTNQISSTNQQYNNYSTNQTFYIPYCIGEDDFDIMSSHSFCELAKENDRVAENLRFSKKELPYFLQTSLMKYLPTEEGKSHIRFKYTLPDKAGNNNSQFIDIYFYSYKKPIKTCIKPLVKNPLLHILDCDMTFDITKESKLSILTSADYFYSAIEGEREYSIDGLSYEDLKKLYYVERNYSLLEYEPEYEKYKDNKMFMLKLIKKYPYFFDYVSERLKTDEDILNIINKLQEINHGRKM